MRGLQRTQLIHARVVLRVGPRGRIEHVVEVLMVPQLIAQRFDLLFGGNIFFVWVSHRKNSKARPRISYLAALLG